MTCYLSGPVPHPHRPNTHHDCHDNPPRRARSPVALLRCADAAIDDCFFAYLDDSPIPPRPALREPVCCCPRRTSRRDQQPAARDHHPRQRAHHRPPAAASTLARVPGPPASFASSFCSSLARLSLRARPSRPAATRRRLNEHRQRPPCLRRRCDRLCAILQCSRVCATPCDLSGVLPKGADLPSHPCNACGGPHCRVRTVPNACWYPIPPPNPINLHISETVYRNWVRHRTAVCY